MFSVKHFMDEYRALMQLETEGVLTSAELKQCIEQLKGSYLGLGQKPDPKEEW